MEKMQIEKKTVIDRNRFRLQIKYFQEIKKLKEKSDLIDRWTEQNHILKK